MKEMLTFDEISKDILANRKFQKISHESHHGITRMEHTLRVARNVYKVATKINCDYVSATRGALLHDFFTNEEFGINLGLVQGVVHPHIALENARGEFGVNEIEADMIVSHMFPLNTNIPKYKESWLLTAVDKVVAIYEYGCYKFNYHKALNKVNLAVLVAFYFITLGRK